MQVYPPMFLAAALLASAACTDVVPVGYDCAAQQRRCVTGSSSDSGGKSDAADASSEAGAEAGGPGGEDGAVDASDAAMDATDGSEIEAGATGPLLRNPSFELTAGGEGQLGSLVNPPEVNPWSRCPDSIAAVEVRSKPRDPITSVFTPDLSPTDGETFVQLNYNTTPGVGGFAVLTQPLARTWSAGTTWALTFDVAAADGNGQTFLRVLGSADACATGEGRELLAESSALDEEGGWTRVCFQMTPENDTDWLVLTAASAPFNFNGSARLFVDNIRESEICPPG